MVKHWLGAGLLALARLGCNVPTLGTRWRTPTSLTKISPTTLALARLALARVALARLALAPRSLALARVALALAPRALAPAARQVPRSRPGLRLRGL